MLFTLANALDLDPASLMEYAGHPNITMTEFRRDFKRQVDGMYDFLHELESRHGHITQNSEITIPLLYPHQSPLTYESGDSVLLLTEKDGQQLYSDIIQAFVDEGEKRQVNTATIPNETDIFTQLDNENWEALLDTMLSQAISVSDEETPEHYVFENLHSYLENILQSDDLSRQKKHEYMQKWLQFTEELPKTLYKHVFAETLQQISPTSISHYLIDSSEAKGLNEQLEENGNQLYTTLQLLHNHDQVWYVPEGTEHRYKEDKVMQGRDAVEHLLSKYMVEQEATFYEGLWEDLREVEIQYGLGRSD